MPLSAPGLAAITRTGRASSAARWAPSTGPASACCPTPSWRSTAACSPSTARQQLSSLADLPPDALLDPAQMARVAGVPPAQVIGPAVVAYADAAILRPLPTAGTRLLTAQTEEAHPAHRGQGYGAEAVSLLAETVITRGMLAQYRTLRANTPSLRLGASLGFAPFAETLAVRL